MVEMSGLDPADGLTKRRLFGLGTGLSLADDVYVETGLLGWASPSQKVDIGATGAVSETADAGEVVIANVPPDISKPGPNDALLSYAWHGRRANLYWIPGRLWSGRTLMGWGVLEQPFGTVVSRSSGGRLTFGLRDPRQSLEAPFQPSKFMGTNVGPVGVEGGPDLKGRPKPVLYGTASNIPAPRVNESLLVYQVADRVASVLCVRDGASALTAGVLRASLAGLTANSPTPGRYDVYAGAEGTFIRLGTTPFFGINVDASEGAAAANRSHARLWERIRLERCGSTAADISAAATTAAHNADAAEAGFWWGTEATRKAALDEVLFGFGAFETQALDGTWRPIKLTLPSGTSVIDLAVLTPSSVFVAKTRELLELQRVRPNYAPGGVPPYRVSVRWGKNYEVMSASQFAGVAPKRLQDKFDDEWRIETVINSAVWDPATNTGMFQNAPELTVESGYIPGADGVSSPAAAGEAARLLAMLSTVRGQYQTSFAPQIGDVLLNGDVVRLTYGGMGLSGGKLFRILQNGLVVNRAGAQMDLVIGLEA